MAKLLGKDRNGADVHEGDEVLFCPVHSRKRRSLPGIARPSDGIPFDWVVIGAGIGGGGQYQGTRGYGVSNSHDGERRNVEKVARPLGTDRNGVDVFDGDAIRMASSGNIGVARPHDGIGRFDWVVIGEGISGLGVYQGEPGYGVASDNNKHVEKIGKEQEQMNEDEKIPEDNLDEHDELNLDELDEPWGERDDHDNLVLRADLPEEIVGASALDYYGEYLVAKGQKDAYDAVRCLYAKFTGEELPDFDKRTEDQQNQRRRVVAFDVNGHPLRMGDAVESVVEIVIPGVATLPKGAVMKIVDNTCLESERERDDKDRITKPGLVGTALTESTGWIDQESGEPVYAFNEGEKLPDWLYVHDQDQQGEGGGSGDDEQEQNEDEQNDESGDDGESGDGENKQDGETGDSGESEGGNEKDEQGESEGKQEQQGGGEKGGEGQQKGGGAGDGSGDLAEWEKDLSEVEHGEGFRMAEDDPGRDEQNEKDREKKEDEGEESFENFWKNEILDLDGWHDQRGY